MHAVDVLVAEDLVENASAGNFGVVVIDARGIQSEHKSITVHRGDK